MICNTGIILTLAFLISMVSAQSCSCRPCRQYSSYYQRCRCCTFHMVGGKRSGASSPLLHFETSAGDDDDDDVHENSNHEIESDDVTDNKDINQVKEDVRNAIKLYTNVQKFFKTQSEFLNNGQEQRNMIGTAHEDDDSISNKLYGEYLFKKLRSNDVLSFQPQAPLNSEMKKIGKSPSFTANKEFNMKLLCEEGIFRCNFLLSKLLQN